MIKQNKAIPHLIKNASKGNLLSKFQLYENFSSSEDKEELIKSYLYMKELETSLKSDALLLESIELTDFRRFKSFEIKFDSDITVIVGGNGTGKTTLLESIAKILSWFNNDLMKEKSSAKHIMPSDINKHSDSYSEIYSVLKHSGKNKYTVSLSRSIDGAAKKKESFLEEIRGLSNMYRVTSAHEYIDFPLMAYYSVDRGNTKPSSYINIEEISDSDRSNRFEALKGALDGNCGINDFLKWFVELSNLANEEVNSERYKLEKEILTFESIIREVYKDEVPDSEDKYVIKLSEKKTELESLEKSSISEEYSLQLKVVVEAIESLIPGVSNIHIHRGSGKAELLLDNFGDRVNFNQISKGQQTMVSLVGDLARRLVVLNPKSNAPLNSKGIVIIDEIDLHLHPEWQQSIVLDFQRTFKNIQFIITTHSPQILSTVDVSSIRQIKTDQEGSPFIEIPKFQTKGVASSDILSRIMGINAIPEHVEEARWVVEFNDQLKNDKKDEADATLLKLIEHFGKEHPVIEECRSQVRMMEMKARYSSEL